MLAKFRENVKESEHNFSHILYGLTYSFVCVCVKRSLERLQGPRKIGIVYT